MDLAEILEGLPPETDPNLIVGRDTREDAGVYRLTDEIALIQTVDFFTPIVNDPYDFGRIAAANALSDVYAMGGRPLTAMNIACFPIKTMEKRHLREILRGGLDKIHESGAALAGGHSIDDPEVKYGLSVTGIVHPNRILINGGARPGDALVLTKPIGTGILFTAVKAGLALPEMEKRGIEMMATLNKAAAEVMERHPVHGCTDVTGFGLIGHGLEVALASGVTLVIEAAHVPVLPGVHDFAAMGLVPAGSYANRPTCPGHLVLSRPIDPVLVDILADAQTSGGLLIALPMERADALLRDLHAAGVEDAALIGEVRGPSSGRIELF